MQTPNQCQLVAEARIENIYSEIEDFLDEIGTHVSHTPTTHDVRRSNHPDMDMVVSALNEVASWAKQQSDLYQVFLSLMLLVTVNHIHFHRTSFAEAKLGDMPSAETLFFL